MTMPQPYEVKLLFVYSRHLVYEVVDVVLVVFEIRDLETRGRTRIDAFDHLPNAIVPIAEQHAARFGLNLIRTSESSAA